MGWFRGPRIVRDGLVMQLDAANVKCFRGEPTVNLLLNPTLSNSGNSWNITNYVSRTPYTFINKGDYYQIEFTRDINISGTDTYFSISQFINISPSTLYTYSISIDATSSFIDTLLSNITNSQVYIQLDWYNINTLLSSSEITINNCNRINLNRLDIVLTATSPSTTTRVLFKCGLDLPNLTSGQYCRLYKPQLEQKDHVTPFVNGTRGVTVATGGGLIDLSNNRNHGEIVNNILYDSNNCGSLKFDGINNYLKTNFSLNTNPSSFDIWFYIDDIPTSNQILFINQYNNTALGFYNTNYFILSAQAVFKRIASNTTLNSHSWNNVIVTYDINGLPYCYINGIETTYSNTNYWSSVARPLLIGCRESSSNNYNTFFTGKIGLFKIYNRQLTLLEIQQNYNATKSRYL